MLQNNSGIEKVYERKEGCHDFRSKIFCRTVRKFFLEEPFCASEKISYRKNLWIKGGRGIWRFSVEKLLSQITEKFRGESFYVSEQFWYRKRIWISRRGSVTIFSRKFLSHSTEKLRRGTELFCVSKNFRYHTILWISGGGSITIFRRNCFVSQ